MGRWSRNTGSAETLRAKQDLVCAADEQPWQTAGVDRVIQTQRGETGAGRKPGLQP